jgi:outer membrane receptor for ferrienterochelin and colicins
VVGSVRAWLLLGCIVLVVRAARADEAAPGGDVQRGGEIVVQERVLEPAEIYEDAPIETEILTEQEIAERPARNAEDVVENLAGIRTQRRLQGEEAAVSIDGMPPEYTRILVDGERYSGEIGEVDDLRDVPLENVERIEVLRGTQGLEYGTDSAGGVINVITRDPPLQGYRVNGNVGAGDDAAFLGSGTAAFGLGGKAGWSISTGQDQIDGFEASDSDPPPAPLNASGHSRRLSRDVYQTLFVPFGESVVLRTRGGWRREDETFENEDEDTGTRPKTQRDYTRWLAAQEAEWFASESTRVTGALRFFQGFTDSSVGRDFEMGEDEWRLEGNVERFVSTGPFSHVLTLGADVRRPTLDLDERDPGTEDTDERFYSSGIYLQDETELAEWASLLLGVRGEFHSEFDARALPQVGLLFRPYEGLKLRVSWGLNYRTPSLRDLFQPPAPQLGGDYFLAGNPDLDPESSQTWRLGFEWNPRSWVALAATGFWNDIDDAIRSVQEQPPTFPPVFRKQNLDELRTRGVETRVLLRPHARFDFSLGYTYTDTELVDSDLGLDELPNTPRNVFDATSTLTLPRTETAVTVQARWRDRALTETLGTGGLGFGSPAKSEPSLFIDVRVLQPLRPGIDLYVDLDNLGDQRVEDSYPVRGRTFFVGLRARFDTTEGGK